MDDSKALDILRTIAPEFKAVSDEEVQKFLVLCVPLVSKKRFGELYDQALALLAVHMLVVCKQSNKHRLLSRLQAAGVVPVYHRASRPDLTDGIRLQGRGKMLPVDKIPAHRVSPMDVIMDIVLVHQMVLAVIIQKPVWVINYMGLGGIVEQRTVRILKIRFSLQAFVTPLPLRSSVP